MADKWIGWRGWLKVHPPDVFPMMGDDELKVWVWTLKRTGWGSRSPSLLSGRVTGRRLTICCCLMAATGWRRWRGLAWTLTLAFR